MAHRTETATEDKLHKTKKPTSQQCATEGSILSLKPKSGGREEGGGSTDESSISHPLRSFLVTFCDDKTSILSSCLGIFQCDNSAHTQSMDI